MTEGDTTGWYVNWYQCPRCRSTWTIEWPEPTPDRCPECGREAGPNTVTKVNGVVN